MMQKTDMLNTKKMKRIFLFGLLALLVVSCSSNSDEQEPTSDDEVTITYPKDTSEHELTDFRCQLVSDENGNHWEIKFDREQVNPFMGGGDEEGVSIVVTNMKDEWKALKDETVVVSGKYRALHTKYFHRNQATITYYSFEITQVRKYEPKPTEPKYQVAKITIDVDNNMAVTSKKDYRGCNIKIESDNDEWDCSMEEDMEMATALCHRYGVTLEVVDCHRDYWDEVTRYTIESVRAGRTPNPDVMCNRMIKFGAFDRKRGHDYDLIATGHYAQTEIDENGVKWLTTSPDPVKDQTDFLAQIYDWQLRKALFPIGHYRKEEIRAIAEREHLVNARRKDSQGICFLGKISYNDYLRRYLGEQEGDIIDIDTEQVIGRHKGHWFHTIGQRKGLGLGGGPWNVVRKDVERNILYVVKGYEPIRAHRMEFNIKDFHFVVSRNSDNTPISEQTPELLQLPKEITFKVRHTPDYFIGTLDDLGNGCYTVHADRWVQGVAPGQFCVIYDSDFHRCFGSGEITV